MLPWIQTTLNTVKNWIERTPKPWTQWALNLLVAFFGGVFAIPLLRKYPKWIHEFAAELSDWQKHLLRFFVCVLFVHIWFNLFVPKSSHLTHWRTHPPAWSAWLIASIFLFFFDVTTGLSPNTFQASASDWFAYAGCSIIVVLLFHLVSEKKDSGDHEKAFGAPRSIDWDASDWNSIKDWLISETPANDDRFDGLIIAKRIKQLLERGIRSVGIVGEFGTGKTTTVDWISRLVEQDRLTDVSNLFVSNHSCWGFETSASSIHTMLGDAISLVHEHIDTFHVTSLPDSYRRTISGGNQWFEHISKTSFRSADPKEQFAHLSDVLRATKTRLVFVVEDLDRNKSPEFDIQEVLGFLHQLKEIPHLSFILTAGLNSPVRIDFAKLCDHIEYMPTVSVPQTIQMITTIREHCFDQNEFPHIRVGPLNDNQWEYKRWRYHSDGVKLLAPDAVSRLLKTPRSLRHAVGRTVRGWQQLFGEVDFDQLLAINVLRFAAPEAFTFVLYHWYRLHSPPSEYMQQDDRLAAVSASLRTEWDEISGNVQWDTKAARVLIDLILPATPEWFGDEGFHFGVETRVQGLGNERHWRRALNEDIGTDEVRDQTVICDMREWTDSPTANSTLIVQICSSTEYSNIWEDLANVDPIKDMGRILLLCQHVLQQICQADGSAASDESQGFGVIYRFANARGLGMVDGNRKWLEDRITEAAAVSLKLVQDLWYYWGHGKYSILQPEDQGDVRRKIIDVLQSLLNDYSALAKIIHPSHPYAIFHLVFDSPNEDATRTGVEYWRWLSPLLLEGLHKNNPTVANAVCKLIATRESHRSTASAAVDTQILKSFFGDSAREVIDAIEQLTPELNEDDTVFARGIVASARAVLGNEE